MLRINRYSSCESNPGKSFFCVIFNKTHIFLSCFGSTLVQTRLDDIAVGRPTGINVLAVLMIGFLMVSYVDVFSMYDPENRMEVGYTFF